MNKDFAASDETNSKNDEKLGNNSARMGRDAQATGNNATAAGNNSRATAEGSSAFGQGAQATAEGATAIGQGAKAEAKGSVALGQGSVADEVNTVSVGSKGNERRITNVKAGVNPTDAVNVSQLRAVENRIQDNEERVNQVANDLRKTKKELRSGIASSMAMANIPTTTVPGKQSIGLGVGSFGGQSAVAVGYSGMSDSGKISIKLSTGATSQGDYGVGAGIGYQW